MHRDKSRRSNRDRDSRYRDSDRDRATPRLSNTVDDSPPPTLLLVFTFVLALLSGALFIYIAGPPDGYSFSFANPIPIFQRNAVFSKTSQNANVNSTEVNATDIHLNRREHWRNQWELKHQQRQQNIQKNKDEKSAEMMNGENKNQQVPPTISSRRAVIRDHVGRIVEPLMHGEEDLGERPVRPAFFIQSSWRDNPQAVHPPNAFLLNHIQPVASRRQPQAASASEIETRSATESSITSGTGPLTVEAPKPRSFGSTRSILSVGAPRSRYTIVHDRKLVNDHPARVGVEAEKSNSASTPTWARKQTNKKIFKGCTHGIQGTDGMVRGYNMTRISHALYKVMRLFGFTSLSDAPAGAHVEWIGELAQQLSFEMPRFRYTGIDLSPHKLARTEQALRNIIDGDFVVGGVENLRTLKQPQQPHQQPHKPHTDLLFYWPEMDGSSTDPGHASYPAHVRRVMTSAKQAGIGYIIVAQYPSMNGPVPTYKHGKWTFIEENAKNVDPFLFNVYIRGAVPMSGTGLSKPYVVYLTFYSLRSIPLSALQV